MGALQGELKSVGESAEARARKNKMIRARLENVKAEVGATVNGLITDMMGMNPEDFMTEAEIDRALTEAFNKFDEDKSGQLGLWEFQQAWFFLELKGSEEEIRDAFKKVDSNNSDLVDLDEFKEAIKSERLLELNMKHLFRKTGVEVGSQQQRYEAFKSTEKRRRLMKQEWDAKVAELTEQIIDTLAGITKTEVPQKAPAMKNVQKSAPRVGGKR